MITSFNYNQKNIIPWDHLNNKTALKNEIKYNLGERTAGEAHRTEGLMNKLCFQIAKIRSMFNHHQSIIFSISLI